MTRRQTYDKIILATAALYGERESASIARLVMERLFGLSRLDIVTDPARQVSEGEDARLDSVLSDLAAGMPVQYVLCSAHFCGLEFAVDDSVLIPRQETEELVRWIIGENDTENPAILDVGAGSGSIAVALAAGIPGARVTGIDISEGALRCAAMNAGSNNVDVLFEPGDILTDSPDGEWFGRDYDIIVSNPPYIPASDKASMHINVKEYEPGEALFVPDDDPLLFYEAIVRHACKLLKIGGRLYFEIYEHFGGEIAELLTNNGFGDIELREDIHGKPRMIRCRK